MADEDLTPRERRAQRAKTGRSDSATSGAGRSMRRYLPVLIVLLVVGAGASAIWFLKSAGQDCPDPHWHATFALFKPGPEGEPVRVDFASPRSVTNPSLHYYDFSSTRAGGDVLQSATLHMHQTGEEVGSTALGPSQWHMEQNGKCIGVKRGLHVVEVEASEDELELFGAHSQVPGQAGAFEATAASPLRWWLQTEESCNVWTWREVSWGKLANYQLQDGESFLGALGNYTPEQVTEMQAQIPAPISRINHPCDDTETASGTSAPTTGPETTADTATLPPTTTTPPPTTTNSTAPA